MSSHLVLVSRSVLVLSQPSDVDDLVPSCLVSLVPLSPTCSTTTLNRLSQAYGCSDRYIKTKILHRGGTTRNNSTRVGKDGTIRPL